MITCTIGGEKRPLRFPMRGMEMAEEQFGSMLRLYAMLRDRARSVKAVNHLLAIMLTCGGFPATHTWVAVHMRAAEVSGVRTAVLRCLKEAMEPTLVQRDDGPVDLVLQENRLKEAERKGGTSAREMYGYGLICGLTMAELRDMDPGWILDMVVVRNQYLSQLLGGGKGRLDRKKRQERHVRPQR